MITASPVNFINDALTGRSVFRKNTYVKDLRGMFHDESAYASLPEDSILYEVDAFFPLPEGTEGGLFFGITRIRPGKIGNEYIFTKGHFHAKSDRGEYYWGIGGEGMLLLMDRSRVCRAEIMKPGSLHYIPAHTAHRVANTGKVVLSFAAAWPSDAGHNYQEIFDKGFSARLIEVNNEPQLVVFP